MRTRVRVLYVGTSPFELRDRQTDLAENITFAIPLAGGNKKGDTL